MKGVAGPVAALVELLLQKPSAELIERISALLPGIEALKSPLRQQAWLHTLRFLIPTLPRALTCLLGPSASQRTKSAAVQYIAWVLMPMNASRRLLVRTSLESAAVHISSQGAASLSLSSRSLTEVAPYLVASGVLPLMVLYAPSSSYLDWVL